jgi:hypothetical protein
LLYCDKAKKKRSGKIGKNEKQGLFYDFWLKKALSRTVETAGKRRNCVEKICKTVVTITISIQPCLMKNVGYNQTEKRRTPAGKCSMCATAAASKEKDLPFGKPFYAWPGK